MQTEPPNADPPKRKRRWLKFSLRTLMILMSLLVSVVALQGYLTYPGKVIFIEDTNDRYVLLRYGRAGYVSVSSHNVGHRPELKYMQEVDGDLDFICRQIHGVDNPLIVVETKNSGHYQVVYKWNDQEALKVISKPLGLIVDEEEREILALTIRELRGGHRLKPAGNGKRTNLDEVACDTEGRWPLDAATLDEIARFLETRYRRPVVNVTSIPGWWFGPIIGKGRQILAARPEASRVIVHGPN